MPKSIDKYLRLESAQLDPRQSRLFFALLFETLSFCEG